jgi:Na+:H+ antiporter, NhaA family
MTKHRTPGSALRRFLSSEAAGGVVLIAAAALAMAVANSPLAEGYFHLLHHATGPTIAAAIGPMTVHLWVNDALMAVFFLLVGLEIKREVSGGELSKPADRRLPVIAAAAGMIVPALLYLVVTGGRAELLRGWAVPAATDIAFAIGVLALAGPRVPAALKLFLATVAIVDDIGAVAIIALFYGSGIDWLALGGAALVLGGMALLNRAGVRRVWPYLLGFAALWVLVLISGVHATVAGVVAAFTIPCCDDEHASPLHRLEHGLSPWVGFGIVPLFGFANAGVSLAGTGAILTQPVVLGVALALFLGKQAGVFGGIRLAVALGVAERPGGASWRQIYGVALLCGIGFTMSLFIGGLAFADAGTQDAVKIGVLAGSILSALAGFAVLRFAPKG